MVSPLKYFKIDPNGLGRGPGVYYLRGKKYYSKYSSSRDAKIKAKNYKVHKIGFSINKKTGKHQGSKIQHTGDGKLSR